MSLWILSAGLGFALALPLTAWARPLARRLGQLDHPGGHKLHQRPIPVLGGVAVYWAVALPLLAAAALPWRPETIATWPVLGAVAGRRAEVLTLLAGAFVLHLAGLADDRIGLRPATKLAVQAAATLPLVVAFDVRLLPTWLDPGWSVALTLLWFLTIVNAFNFLDGLDGLLGGVATICALLFGLTAVMTQQLATAALLGLLAGALAGFLVFNLPPASIFMGDCGSLVVGYLMAYGSVTITYRHLASQAEAPWYTVLTPLVVLAIPLYDFVTVVGLRLAQTRNPVEADNQHFSHRLRRRGMSGRKTLVVICACTLATGMGGLLLVHLEAWQAILVAVQTLTILLVLGLIEAV